ncbi:holo-[acyl-carrier-protein] synthase [Sporosarcina sp. ANT_H38]|uniref:holo-ACP synthase n=1 Tax=Sporosarcina sp. ANT_H38 TaxID=2597358 RepID=UPI0011F34696|nr:holo-ACP synthase [Sporosarcina sp. ANT_H38]KAA0948422.1 holo-[acyl-carrier-protein] synthase [Sporosarcina sp. ANT_H38]
MIAGIGLDIVELDRIAKLDARSSKFRMRILTKEELEIYESHTANRRTEFLAGRFAGKEAFSKAKGTGIGTQCSFMDISILPEHSGKPIIYFKGVPSAGFISITHTQTVAAAQVILLA